MRPACAEVVKLAETTADKGNLNVISRRRRRGAVGLCAALTSAALNVRVNAASIKDRDFADGAAPGA